MISHMEYQIIDALMAAAVSTKLLHITFGVHRRVDITRLVSPSSTKRQRKDIQCGSFDLFSFDSGLGKGVHVSKS